MYEAIVVKLKADNFKPHPNADKLELYLYNGNQVVIQKGTYQPNDMCLYFIPDTQISDWFLREHKLYRKNPDDETEKWPGFFEQNGRVKTIKLRNEYSQGFMFKLPQDTTLKEGNIIDELNGKHLCHKYLTKEEQRYLKAASGSNKGKSGKFNIIQWVKNKLNPKLLTISTIPQHIDTKHLVYGLSKFNTGDLVTLTEKVHGTSGRTGKLTLQMKVYIWNKEYWEDGGFTGLSKVITTPVEQSGSRRKIVYDSYLSRVNAKGYYGDENWRVDIHHNLIKKTDADHVLFYEVVGYTPNGGKIMPDHSLDKKVYQYAYGCQPGEYDIYIYRIIRLNDDGSFYEFQHHEIEEYCTIHGLQPVRKIDEFVYMGEQDEITNRVLEYCDENQFQTWGDTEQILEGVVVRNDDIYHCNFLKFKSDAFSEAEGISKQSEKFVDMESMG
jgi:hypothetical protein